VNNLSSAVHCSPVQPLPTRPPPVKRSNRQRPRPARLSGLAFAWKPASLVTSSNPPHLAGCPGRQAYFEACSPDCDRSMASGTPNKYSPPAEPVRVAPASRQIGNSRWPNLKLTSLGSCVASSGRTHTSTVRGVSNDRWKWTRHRWIRTALETAPFLVGHHG
jgi:hypothetical protein